ncbi:MULTISPECIES: 4-hydroxy-tetrahydrodipicolinate synthase [unclassified Rhizobium]|uniref:4-hydroxy-tetrahydrodipicolinate synthase n=1 Tax=unclassified Rhizobium TaxID=2613769 RepID=UPI000BD0E7FE|nr:MULTISPECIES: 4-hydroxy-tetrahydrodipicolinate synthase [unclassified Rhizobium]MDH7808653.1 4-hydroxy-tetrahydrodipicolinate synthase [Rhizobium sp. AN67]MDQ4408850.1 4-hydroxy-tetrahydrodipicolinate synthase [Rhizobium sp. AN63]SOD50757.1 4-hydroxy-tetrahydrodipicolinate synthase [Rhizobium sp. AN6A]
MQEQLHGKHRFSGTMTALVTPFLGNGIDYAAFDHLVEWQIDQGIDGLVLNTLIAEGPTLKTEERRSLISRCVHLTRGRIPVIAATGTNSTATTCERTIEAEQLGADAVLIVQPYYSRPSQKGVIHHFKEAAKRVQLPIFLHNDPRHTAVEISHCTVNILLQIPNVVGLVDDTRTMARIAKSVDHAAADVIYLCGDDFAGDDAIAASHGSISAVANMCPATVSSMQRAIRAGDAHQAQHLHQQLLSLASAVSLENTSASLKHALSCLRGIDDAVRLPMTNISDETAHAVMRALKPLRHARPRRPQSPLILEARTARISQGGDRPS